MGPHLLSCLLIFSVRHISTCLWTVLHFYLRGIFPQLPWCLLITKSYPHLPFFSIFRGDQDTVGGRQGSPFPFHDFVSTVLAAWPERCVCVHVAAWGGWGEGVLVYRVWWVLISTGRTCLQTGIQLLPSMTTQHSGPETYFVQAPWGEDKAPMSPVPPKVSASLQCPQKSFQGRGLPLPASGQSPAVLQVSRRGLLDVSLRS